MDNDDRLINSEPQSGSIRHNPNVFDLIKAN